MVATTRRRAALNAMQITDASSPTLVDSERPYHTMFPAELWSRVFAFSVNDEPRSRDTILHVNRAFRFIANTTPQLWTQISVTSREDVLNPHRMMAELQKSGALPLHVHISMESETDNIILSARYLRKHVSRFQTLHLKLPSAQVTAMFLSAMGQDCPAPLLQRLTLEVFETNEDDFETDEDDFETDEDDFETDEDDFESITLGSSIFYPSPRLVHLSIHPPLLPAVTNSTLLRNVKDFTFAGEDFYLDEEYLDRVIALLSRTPLMESFTLRAYHIISAWLLSTSVVMPHLLSVDMTIPGSGLKVFFSINAPLLQRVYLETWVDSPVDLLLPALRSLSRRSPKISHLELHWLIINDSAVIFPWIMGGGFPSPEVLKISACKITDDVLRLCKPVKMMKRLELAGCPEVTRDGLLHVIQGCSSDFELKICRCHHITQDDVAALSEVVNVEYIEYIEDK